MNEKDLRDIEPYVIGDLTIHFVENIEDVLAIAFPGGPAGIFASFGHHEGETEDIGSPRPRL